MKNFMKVMLIIAAAFTAVGIGLSVGGVAMGATMESVGVFQKMRGHYEDFWENRDWAVHNEDDIDDDDDDWDEDEWGEDDVAYSEENGSYEYQADAVKNVKIDLKYDELILEENEGDTIHIKVSNDSARNVKVKSDSNSLEIKSTKRKSNRTITVSYPAGTKFTEMEISVDAGTVEMMDRMEAEKLEVSVGAGQFTNSDTIIATEADIEVGTGEVDIMELTADKIDGECGIGSMSLELSGREADYNYKLECGIGEISINNDSFTTLAGEKKINNGGATKSINLECGMGEISVDFENE